MIEKEEIDAKSEELGVHVSNVQRDYVFGWLLAGLFDATNPLRHRLSLKGGNAFRKGYFENARFSNDLDFSAPGQLSEEELLSAVVRASQFAGERSGVDFRIANPIVRAHESADRVGRTYDARVYFRSFYGEDQATIRVNLDVREFDRILLPVQERTLIHSYSDAAECRATVRCHKLEELLASKLVALLHRQHSPDLFDFVYSVFFQRSLELNRREVITTFLRKTIYERSPGTARQLLLGLPFAVFKGIWDEYLVCPRSIVMRFEEAAEGFKASIAELFGMVTPQPTFAAVGGVAPTFYGPSVRNTLLEAGRLQRIVRMFYDGIERRVEPYALVFKTRKDGTGHEYFYGWDLSGGRSGQIGIKSFFADKVGSIQMTDESFDPKFPIELTKGSSTGYFSRASFSASATRASRPARANLGRRYTIECPYCNKRFQRTRMETKLTDHKDRFGNRCPGRIGRFVGIS